jgi:hypothetical protein
MPVTKMKKNKKNPHYGFLISWDQKMPKKANVKGETKFDKNKGIASFRHSKKADYLAQAEANSITKKTIIRSLITISLILILELVVYLAWTEIVK